MSFSQNYLYSLQPIPIFNEKVRLSLSKQRIIQKNLVHFQGFPDSLYNEILLLSPEYLGQYGNIRKIVLVSKEDKVSHKKVNSAYITFETNEQAAYCILCLDSIKINGQMVRAFFGTTKYCYHFLSNYQCFNKEKCMFLHHMAEPSDIIDENTKFGYNEHINLAKKIVGFGSLQSKYYVANNSYAPISTVFPNIKSIYSKEDSTTKNIIHLRQNSNLSNNSTNNSSNRSNTRNMSESSSKEKDKNSNKSLKDKININFTNNSDDFNDDNDNNDDDDDETSFDCFTSRKKSRFFNSINIGFNDDYIYGSKNLTYIVNNLCRRMAFFNYFRKFNQSEFIKSLEINYCMNLYKETNDNEIKLLFDNNF
jgi:hypothetical protein